jgi:cytochrome c
MTEAIVRWCFGLLVATFVLASAAAAAPIHDAAKKGDVPAIVAALAAGANVNESDGWATPLYYAIRRGQENAAKLLIARGADVNLTTESSGPPIHGAVERKSGNLVKLLLASGANPNAVFKAKSALYLAAAAGCLECVEALVEAGADVNALNEDRATAMHAAKLVGHHEISDYLAAHGAVTPKIASVSTRLGSADPAKGQAIFFMNCDGCHFVNRGKARKVGPNLWGVVGRKKASMQDFPYSEALKDWGASWSYEDLNAFLWGPKIIAPGVRMQFVGIEDEAERANLIAFLRLQSDQPEPLP